MTATQELHEMGQSLWLDNITRGLLTSGTLRRYIQEFSVTGLTSNPTIFDHAIKNSHDYDNAIRQKVQEGKSGEALFFELALEDLRQAADLFRPIHDQTNGVDGWVSLEVSPLLAHDTAGTITARSVNQRASLPVSMTWPHGAIRAIDTARASAFPGVRAVITGADCDVPYGVLPIAQNEYPLARERVRYVGEPIAAVAAIDEATAQAALDLIAVDYHASPKVP